MMVVKIKTFIGGGILAACTLAMAEEIIPTPTPWPTYWPTYMPTYTPTANGELLPLRCPSSFDNYVEIDDAASLQYSIVPSDSPIQSGIFCGRLFVDSSDSWVAIAFSEDGNMPGSDAIVADLENESVLKYHLGGRDAAAVTLMEDAKQTLQNTCVGAFGSMSVVSFTKFLVEEDEVTINADGMNIFLHARGDSWPGYHASRKVFVDIFERTRTIESVCDETRPCSEGEYCKFEPGICLDDLETREGLCVRIQDNCNWPVSYMPICGCDGKTYGNECEVDEMGTSVAYEGECEEAIRQIDLTQIDPDSSCPDNQCLDPDGKCGLVSSCVVDPCEAQDECSTADCEANYCGGCHHTCNVDITNLSPIFCPEIWEPVCGDDNSTYSNTCEANRGNVKVIHEGECKALVEPEEKCSLDSVCSTEGSSCTIGTETCCGQTYDSVKCNCIGGRWVCFHTEACMIPPCCLAGPPKDKPLPSMDFCEPGLACDTEFEDDYCCSDFMNPGNTYCSKSGGPVDSESLSTTTSTTTTTASAPPETDPPSLAPTNSTVPSSALTSSPSAQPITTQTTSTEGTISTTSQTTTAPSLSPTVAQTSSPTEPPFEAQTTSTSGTNSTPPATQTSSATTASETASTTTALPESTASTILTTTTMQTSTSQTSSTNSFTTDNPVSSSASSESTITAATSSATVPSTTTAFSFNIDFSTTTTIPQAETSPEDPDQELTTTEATQAAIGTIEGRPFSTSSASKKSVISMFSLSSTCLALLAWNSM